MGEQYPAKGVMTLESRHSCVYVFMQCDEYVPSLTSTIIVLYAYGRRAWMQLSGDRVSEWFHVCQELKI